MSTKQVMVVRKDLNMRTGKLAAQVAHASFGVFQQKSVTQAGVFQCLVTEPMQEWINGDYTKICVYVESEQELEALYYQALEAEIPACLIVDSGKTEFNGIPTKTVVAIGPDVSDKIDTVTKDLPLL